MNVKDLSIKLEAPGKGLPPVESFIARYILFPITTSRLTRPKAINMLEEFGQRGLSLAKSLTSEQLNQRQLIKRFPGIEDSSRYWSVLMTLHHLWITGDAMAGMTERLVKGEPVKEVVRIEAVKPSPQETVEVVFSRYETFLSGYRERMNRLSDLDFTAHRHEHPWFGFITAHQWLCLNTLHHRIHLKQIQNIIKEII